MDAVRDVRREVVAPMFSPDMSRESCVDDDEVGVPVV